MRRRIHQCKNAKPLDVDTPKLCSPEGGETPRHWFVVDTMPLTGSGKIQKFKLREQWSKGEIKEL
jgi:acyl-CoA synthetase (AMP-forming)/AMP-acid ligase II